MPFQYGNPANPRAHERGTAEEILADCPEIDVFVAGLGTGGTLMGCARRLRRDRPDMQIVAAEPLPGEGIDGLRSLEDGYTPEILDLSLLDRKLLVSNAESVRGLRALAREEGLFAGVSSGGVAARRDARRARARRPREHRHGARRRRLEVPLRRPLGHARGRARSSAWSRASGGEAPARAGRRDDRPRPLGAPERGLRHLRRHARGRAAHVPPGAQRGREPVPLQRRRRRPAAHRAGDRRRRRRGRRHLPLAHDVAARARRAPTWSSRPGPRRPT